MKELDYCSRYFEPPDVDAASDAWNAHCGPISFAAITGKTLAETKQHFDGIERRHYVNPTQMQAALDHAGIDHLHLRPYPWVWTYARLGLIQITGPWCSPGVSPKAAYRYTHWVAMRSEGEGEPLWVYDCNVAFWIDVEDWKTQIVTQLITHTDRADGWNLRLAYALNRRHVAAGVVAGGPR